MTITVRLLATHDGNPPGTIVRLPDALATAFVAAGNATLDLTGGINKPPPPIKRVLGTLAHLVYSEAGAFLGIGDADGNLVTTGAGATIPVGITAPGAPTAFTLTAAAGAVVGAFTAPASNGGDPVLRYEMDVTVAGQAMFTVRGEASPLAAAAPAGLLASAQMYAVNSVGRSAASGAATATPTGPAVASAITLTGPTTGTLNTATGVYTATLSPGGSTVAAPVTVTPTPVAGVTFAPTSLTLTTASPSGTFTATATTSGTKSIAITNNGGLTNPAAISLVIAAAATPATALTMSGPTTGVVGLASSNYSVALAPTGGTVSGTVVATPSDGGAGGTFAPTSLSLTTASPSGAFTYTPASAGVKTISLANNGGLTAPASLTYTATAPVATMLTSASSRVQPSVAGGAVAGANNFRTARHADYAVTPVTSPTAAYGNWWVNVAAGAAVSQELATINVVPYSAAWLTGVTGTGLAQTGATLTPMTFQNAAAGVAGYLIKLDGSNASAAEFTAAGGTITGDFLTIGIPGGYTARSDPATGLTLSGAYFIQTEIAPAVGAQYVGTVVAGPRTDLGDQIKDGAARTGVYVKDWTTLGVTSAGNTCAPIEVMGVSATAVKTVGVAGDSIARDNFDRDATTALYGNTRGAVAFIARALNDANYASVKVAISASNAQNPYTVPASYNMRAWMLRHCSVVFTDMGHNDRSATFANMMLYQRAHWARLRSAGVGGAARVIATTLNPLATSTDLWATKANQTPSTIAGSMQFDSYNPFIKAGVFNGTTDCDASYDLIGDMYLSATAVDAAADVTPGYVPTNGTANFFYNDSTHMKSILHVPVAARLQAKLPALVGF